MKIEKHLWLLTAASLTLLTAWSITPELRKREGTLSNYNLIQQVDDANFRYTNPDGLARCKQFHLSPIKILVTDFEGKPTTPEQRQAVAGYIKGALARVLGDKYAFVNQAGPDTGEMRIAVTDVYRKSGKMGISLEAEVLDITNTQVFAVMASELSDKAYMGAWNNAPVFRAIVDGMADRFRQRLDEANAK